MERVTGGGGGRWGGGALEGKSGFQGKKDTSKRLGVGECFLPHSFWKAKCECHALGRFSRCDGVALPTPAIDYLSFFFFLESLVITL